MSLPSEEKKTKYCRERYKNLPEKEKQKLAEYRKKILSNVKKILIMIIKKLFSFRKCTSILKSNDLELCFSRID